MRVSTSLSTSLSQNLKNLKNGSERRGHIEISSKGDRVEWWWSDKNTHGSETSSICWIIVSTTQTAHLLKKGTSSSTLVAVERLRRTYTLLFPLTTSLLINSRHTDIGLCGNQDSRRIRYHIISDNINIDTWECWVVTTARVERSGEKSASHRDTDVSVSFRASSTFSFISCDLVKLSSSIDTQWFLFHYYSTTLEITSSPFRLAGDSDIGYRSVGDYDRSRDVSSRDLKRYRSSHHLNSWETVWWRTIWWCTDDSVLSWRIPSEQIRQI